jgi:hypothetical protein
MDFDATDVELAENYAEALCIIAEAPELDSREVALAIRYARALQHIADHMAAEAPPSREAIRHG